MKGRENNRANTFHCLLPHWAEDYCIQQNEEPYIYWAGGGGGEWRKDTTWHTWSNTCHPEQKTCWPSLTPTLHLSPHGITRLLVVHCADHLLVHTNSAIIIHMFLVSILTASTHPSCTIISFTSHNSIIPHPSFHHLYILTVLLIIHMFLVSFFSHLVHTPITNTYHKFYHPS